MKPEMPKLRQVRRNPRRYTDTIHVKARVLGLFHVNPLVTDVRCIQQESKE
jgi:hypothetical protein